MGDRCYIWITYAYCRDPVSDLASGGIVAIFGLLMHIAVILYSDLASGGIIAILGLLLRIAVVLYLDSASGGFVAIYQNTFKIRIPYFGFC